MGCGTSSQPTNEAGKSSGAVTQVKPKEAIITVDSILAEDPHDPPKVGGRRKWIAKLPECFKKEASRELTEAEIEAAKGTCGVLTSMAATDRKPKLIVTIGAAGAGKSCKMKECFEKFEAEQKNVVISDGDEVRDQHAGIQAALKLTKKNLLAGLEGEEKAEYEKLLANIEDDQEIGFKDCEDWVYGNSAAVKKQFFKEGREAKKDCLLALTALKDAYKKCVEAAVEEGYQVYAAGFVVKPKTLLTRQIGRAQTSGRMITVDEKAAPDGDLHKNTVSKQAKAIKGILEIFEICEKTGGYAILYDNSPDFKAPGYKPLAPVYERKASEPPTGDLQGFSTDITIKNVEDYINQKIQPG